MSFLLAEDEEDAASLSVGNRSDGIEVLRLAELDALDSLWGLSGGGLPCGTTCTGSEMPKLLSSVATLLDRL